MRSFAYVGPEEIRIRSRSSPSGTEIHSRDSALEWLGAQDPSENGWATYVVNLEGVLVVAPRRSEHVACAGGEAVLGAGEMRFDASGGVTAVTNNSTGYCPSEDCWSAVREVLDRAGVAGPSAFTFVAIFRRCPRCGERNLVKDGWFVCALCDGDLPQEWNFA